MTPLRIATRRSPLALAQARAVAAAMAADTELVEVTTSGDRDAAQGDKSRWVAELEQVLLAGEADIAVHSAKDVPSELADGLEIAGAPKRADARDALCGAPSLAALPPSARIGTSSLRRSAQIRALRNDLELIELRGNVDTRLRRLADGDFDAIVLARAGLERLGRDTAAALDELVPAAGQGTLALQARVGDERVAEAIAPLRDPATEAALAAERALVAALGADCHTPLGAHAVHNEDGALRLRAFIGMADGSTWLRDQLDGGEPEWLGREVGARLLATGAAEMLG